MKRYLYFLGTKSNPGEANKLCEIPTRSGLKILDTVNKRMVAPGEPCWCDYCVEVRRDRDEELTNDAREEIDEDISELQ